MPRFRVVSKHQVSGWRFLLHRIEHALVRRDASMIDDPQHGHSTALFIGTALAFVGVAGAAILAYLKPAGAVGSSPIIADQTTGALYVHVGQRLYPVLNLTSARLIVGQAANPVRVATDELDQYPRGPLVGIPGAPGAMIGSTDRTSDWSVCDTAQVGAAAPVDPETGLPTQAQTPVRDTVIGGPLTVDSSTVRNLGPDEARLLRQGNRIWLVYADSNGRVVRAQVNLTDPPVTLALGLDANASVLPASKGLINAIPEAPAITVPTIPGSGTGVTLSSGLNTKVGSILTEQADDRSTHYYMVLPTGVIQVSPVLAAMIRNTNSEGQVQVTAVTPDVIAANLRPGSWPSAATYPPRPVHLVDATGMSVTCYSWARNSGDPAAHLSLLVGRQLPLTPGQQAAVVDLPAAQGSNGAVADSAYMPRTTGRFVQLTGEDPTSTRHESLWWVADNGIRYGIDAPPPGMQSESGGSDQTLTALGLGSPVSAPWTIVSLFAPGPTLSQRDARVQHDGIAPDNAATGLATGDTAGNAQAGSTQ